MKRPKRIKDAPLSFFLTSLIATVAAYFVAVIFYPDQASLATLLLSVVIITPVVHKYLSRIEDDVIHHKKHTVEEVVTRCSALFAGQLVAYLLLYIFLTHTANQGILTTTNIFTGLGDPSYPPFFAVIITYALLLLLTIGFSLAWGAGMLLILGTIASSSVALLTMFEPQGFTAILAIIIWMILIVIAAISGGTGSGFFSIFLLKHDWTTKNGKLVSKLCTQLWTTSIVFFILAAIVYTITVPLFF